MKPIERLPRPLLLAAACAALGTSAFDANASADLAVGDATLSLSRQSSTMVFNVTRSGDTDYPVSVQYATADGSAVVGTDYTAKSGTLSFGVGETTKQVLVPVMVKLTPKKKTFTLNLSQAAVTGVSSTFSVAATAVVPQFAEKGVAADFNGDGKIDIMVGGNTSGNSSAVVLRNDTVKGSTVGTFTPAATVADFFAIYAASASDLNQDGKADIVVNADSGTYVYMNTTPTGAAAITFAPPVVLEPATNATFGDIDGDGKIDLAIAHHGLDIVRIYRNTTPAGATAVALTKVLEAGVGQYPNDVTVLDVNGDGKPDIATANFSGANVSVLMNTTPAGGAISFSKESRFGVSGGATGIATADFNGDGKADLTTADGGQSLTGTTFDVLMNTTAKGASTPTFIVSSFLGGTPYGAAASDVDGDGQADVLIASQTGSIDYYLNRTQKGAAKPSLEPARSVPIDGAGRWVVAADFNGDGRVDFASSDWSGTGLSVFFQAAPSTSTPTATIIDPSGTGTFTTRKGN